MESKLEFFKDLNLDKLKYKIRCLLKSEYDYFEFLIGSFFIVFI